MMFFFPRGVLDEILNLIESVSDGFPSYSYILARSKLGCSLKQLMTGISTANGHSCVSNDTVWRWKKKFESGVESIKNASKSGGQNLHLVKKSLPK